MYTKQDDDIRADQFKKEFSLLRESDYWQYLPDITRNKIVDMLDDGKWIKCRHRGEDCLPENPLESSSKKLVKIS